MDHEIEEFCKRCSLCTKSSRFNIPLRTPSQVRSEALHIIYDTWSADVVRTSERRAYTVILNTVCTDGDR